MVFRTLSIKHKSATYIIIPRPLNQGGRNYVIHEKKIYIVFNLVLVRREIGKRTQGDKYHKLQAPAGILGG